MMETMAKTEHQLTQQQQQGQQQNEQQERATELMALTQNISDAKVNAKVTECHRTTTTTTTRAVAAEALEEKEVTTTISMTFAKQNNNNHNNVEENSDNGIAKEEQMIVRNEIQNDESDKKEKNDENTIDNSKNFVMKNATEMNRELCNRITINNGENSCNNNNNINVINSKNNNNNNDNTKSVTKNTKFVNENCKTEQAFNIIITTTSASGAAVAVSTTTTTTTTTTTPPPPSSSSSSSSSSCTIKQMGATTAPDDALTISKVGIIITTTSTKATTAEIITTTRNSSLCQSANNALAQCDNNHNSKNNNNKNNNNGNGSGSSSSSSNIITVAVENNKSQQQQLKPLIQYIPSSSLSSSLSSNDMNMTTKPNTMKIETDITITTTASETETDTTIIKKHEKRQQLNNKKKKYNKNRVIINDNNNNNKDRQLIPKQPRAVLLTAVNPHIVCSLCFGYLIDATTIVECLHSFCRSCLIRHLRTQEYCPRCEMVINTAKPNIKPDTTLQAIVYKLVPALYERELLRKRAFYKDRPEDAASATPEQRGDDTEHLIFSPSEYMSLSLEYADTNELIKQQNVEFSELLKARYIKCPAMFTIYHLKKMVMGKFQIDANRFIIDIMYKVKTIVLLDHYTLMDVAYIYTWKRDAPMRFYFRVKQRLKPLIHLSKQLLTNSIHNVNNTAASQNVIESDKSNEVKPMSLISTTNTAIATSTITHTSALTSTTTCTPTFTTESVKPQPEKEGTVSLLVNDIKEEKLEPKEIKVENNCAISSRSEVVTSEAEQFEIMTKTECSSSSRSPSDSKETESLKITLISKTAKDKMERKPPTSLKVQNGNEKGMQKMNSASPINQHQYHHQHNHKDERKVENIKLKIDLSKQNSVTIINMSQSNRKEIVKSACPDKEWKVKAKTEKGSNLSVSPQKNQLVEKLSPLTVSPITIKTECVSSAATKLPNSITTPPNTSPNQIKGHELNEDDNRKSQFLKSFSLTPIKATRLKLLPENDIETDQIEPKVSSSKSYESSSICKDLKELLPAPLVKPPPNVDITRKTCSKRKIKEPTKTIVKKAKLSPTSMTAKKTANKEDLTIKLPSVSGNNTTTVNTINPFKAPKLPQPNNEHNKFVNSLMPPPMFRPALKNSNSSIKQESRAQSLPLKATTSLTSANTSGCANSYGVPLTINQHAHGIQIAPPGNRTPIAKRYHPILPKATRPNPFANIPADVNKILKEAGTEIKTIPNDNMYGPKVYGPKLDNGTFIISPTKINQYNQHKLEADFINTRLINLNQRDRSPTDLISNATNSFSEKLTNTYMNTNVHTNTHSTNNYLNLALFNASKSKGNEMPSACRTPIYAPNSPIYSPSSPQYVSNYNIPTMPTYKYTPKPITSTSSVTNNNKNNNNTNSFLPNVINTKIQKMANLFPNPPVKKDFTPTTVSTESTPNTPPTVTSSAAPITRNNISSISSTKRTLPQQHKTDVTTITSTATITTSVTGMSTTDNVMDNINIGSKRSYAVAIRSPPNLHSDGGKNFNNCNNSDDPPEKQLKMKSLLTSCNINIPSSLSITITREDTESPANPLTYQKHKSPVNNYIEILKLPDQPQVQSNNNYNDNNIISNSKQKSVTPPFTHSINGLMNSQHQQKQQQQQSSSSMNQRLNSESSSLKHEHKHNMSVSNNNSVRISLKNNNNNNTTNKKISSNKTTLTPSSSSNSIQTQTTDTSQTPATQCFNTNNRNFASNMNRILGNNQKLSTNQMNENGNISSRSNINSTNQQERQSSSNSNSNDSSNSNINSNNIHNNNNIINNNNSNNSNKILSPVKTPSPEKKLSPINNNTHSSSSSSSNNSSNNNNNSPANAITIINNEQKSPISSNSMEYTNNSGTNNANVATSKRFRHILPRQMHQLSSSPSPPSSLSQTITTTMATITTTSIRTMTTAATTVMEANNASVTTKKFKSDINNCGRNVDGIVISNSSICSNINNNKCDNGNVIGTYASPNVTAIKIHSQRKVSTTRKSNQGNSQKSMLTPKHSQQTIDCSNVATINNVTQQNVKQNRNNNNSNNKNKNINNSKTPLNSNNNVSLAINSNNADNTTPPAATSTISLQTLPSHLDITAAAAAAAVQQASERVNISKMFKENLLRAQVQAAAAANSSNIFYSYAAANAAAAAQMSQYTPMYNYQQAYIIEQLSRMQRVGHEAFTEYMQKLKDSVQATTNNKIISGDQKGIIEPKVQPQSVSQDQAQEQPKLIAVSTSTSKLSTLQQTKSTSSAKTLLPSSSQSPSLLLSPPALTSASVPISTSTLPSIPSSSCQVSPICTEKLKTSSKHAPTAAITTILMTTSSTTTTTTAAAVTPTTTSISTQDLSITTTTGTSTVTAVNASTETNKQTTKTV